MDSVIFALRPEAVPPAEHQMVVVSPSYTSWNDFGFRIRVDILILSALPETDRLSLPGYFGFVGPTDAEPDVRLLTKLLEKAPGGRLGASSLPKFFMMLPDMGAYRELVAKLGPEGASKILVALKDVVAADEALPGFTSAADAKETQVFKEAFLRTSESFFAWANAGSVLRGLQHEDFARISNRLKLRFQLDGRPNPHELEFSFGVQDSTLPRRFAVIIGKNGVGKSQTLGRLAKAALSGSGSLTDSDGVRPRLNRLIAFVPNSASASVFPSEPKRDPRIWYRRFALNPSRRGRGGRSTTELILRLARSEDRIGASDRFEIFLKAISTIERWEEIGVTTAFDQGGTIRLGQLRRGSEQERLRVLNSINLRREPTRILGKRSFPLSSGEQSFLRFAALTSLHIENGSLLLFDEPETHLHPEFISQLVAVLDSLLEQTGSVAIIATHSVYFVREAFEDQVIVLRSDEDRSIRCESPTLKTFGADVGAISYFVFGEDRPSRLAKQVEDEIARTSSSWDEAFDRFKGDLSLELLGEIRARIAPADKGGRG